MPQIVADTTEKPVVNFDIAVFQILTLAWIVHVLR